MDHVYKYKPELDDTSKSCVFREMGWAASAFASVSHPTSQATSSSPSRQKIPTTSLTGNLIVQIHFHNNLRDRLLGFQVKTEAL